MDKLELARNVFDHDRYASHLSQITIENMGDHTAECKMPLTENHCNARGVAMGGALSTLADFTTAVAANSECLEGDLLWVSLDAIIHYLAPATCGSILMATCIPLKVGRTTALYQTTIDSLDNSRHIAIVETTMIHL